MNTVKEKIEWMRELTGEMLVEDCDVTTRAHAAFEFACTTFVPWACEELETHTECAQYAFSAEGAIESSKREIDTLRKENYRLRETLRLIADRMTSGATQLAEVRDELIRVLGS